MVALMEGQEISIDDEAAWSAVTFAEGPSVGGAFCFHQFPYTVGLMGSFSDSRCCPLTRWSMVVHVKFFGAEDPDV